MDIIKKIIRRNDYPKFKRKLLEKKQETYFIEVEGEIKMAKISEELLSKYLKPEDIEGSKEVKIVGEHSEEQGEFGINFILPIEMDKKQFNMRLNKTNVLRLVDKFKSNDTEEWIDKKFDVSVIQVMVKGDKKNSFYDE